MKTPPLLLGGALLFWGWHTGFFVGALIMACVLEGSRLVHWRWDISTRDVRRIRMLCVLVLVIMLAYLLATVEPLRAFLAMISLYPLTVLPLVLAHVYGTAGMIDATMLLFGKPTTSAWGKPRTPIDPSYPYLAVVILAAAAANVRAPWFYAGACLVSAWALWVARPKTHPRALWMGLLATAAALGYGGQIGLHSLQDALEGGFVRWLSDFTSGSEADPEGSHTAIGYVGALKLSEAIVLRVEPMPGETVPFLLQEASFVRYIPSIWLPGGSDFAAVHPEPDGTTWRLAPDSGPHRSMILYTHLKNRRGILALPSGTSRIEDLQVGAMQRNRLGTVKVQEGPGLVTYRALFAPGVAHAAAPDDRDLRVPKGNVPVISRIVTELGLSSQTPHQVLEALTNYFQGRFRYSTVQPYRPTAAAPLEHFLLQSRSGHCEYFATATVLLLRQAGIPARYATGYMVQEFSPLENRHIVRARHAHAWALAYIDGAWRSFDTTPASWMTVEQRTASWRTGFFDLWSWVTFQAFRWWNATPSGIRSYLGWLLIPLGVLLVWRWFGFTRFPRLRRRQRDSRAVRSWPGQDSEFYALEKRLDELGFGRHPSEPVARWVQRIEAHHALLVAPESLRTVVLLHSRYRFDPEGIGTVEREALRAGVRSLLAQVAAKPPIGKDSRVGHLGPPSTNIREHISTH